MLSTTNNATTEYLNAYSLHGTFSTDPTEADFLKKHESLADGLSDHGIIDPVAWLLAGPHGSGCNGTTYRMVGASVVPPTTATDVESRDAGGPGWTLEQDETGAFVPCDVPAIRGPLLFARWAGLRYVVFDRSTAPRPRSIAISRGRWD